MQLFDVISSTGRWGLTFNLLTVHTSKMTHFPQMVALNVSFPSNGGSNLTHFPQMVALI